jgi:hypothetical protein
MNRWWHLFIFKLTCSSLNLSLSLFSTAASVRNVLVEILPSFLYQWNGLLLWVYIGWALAGAWHNCYYRVTVSVQ